MTKPQTTKADTLLRLARRGPVRSRDLSAHGIPRSYLARFVQRGILEQVDRGLYRLVDAPMNEQATLVDVCKRAPGAIVCLLSALQLHNLTTETPHAVWLLIDAHARPPSFSYPKLVIIRATGIALDHGVEVRRIDGTPVRVTTPAKTVADCFRFRRHVGLDVALEALRDYLRRERNGMDALVAAARADRVYSVMRPYIEATI